MLAQAWGLTESSQRGPKPELSLEAIVDTSIRIADAEGLEAVTMARVAKELGFTTMSLYRHVGSKDDLLQLMNDAAADIPIPTEAESRGTTWRDTLTAWTREGRRHYLRHPWKLEIPVGGVPSMPNTVRVADWALRGMRDLPITDGERISLLLTLSSLASSFARLDVELHRAVEAYGADEVVGAGFDTALAHLITKEQYPDLNRLIVAGAYFGGGEEDFANEPPDDLADEDGASPMILEFEYALALVLDGLESLIARTESDRE